MSTVLFLAHPKAMEEDQLESWKADILEYFREEYADIEVVYGRDDYSKHALGAGSFGAWARDVPTRKSLATGKTVYAGLFVPDRYVGKATAEMVSVALNTRMPVLVGTRLDDGGITVQQATRLEVLDAQDYLKGWCVEVD
jgi:hypothetical protein